jgi:hypothetical protein
MVKNTFPLHVGKVCHQNDVALEAAEVMEWPNSFSKHAGST